MAQSLPVVPSPDTIHRALGEFQLTANKQQVHCIQQYMGMLLKWNEAVNLTAIRDPLEILYRHFCESMFATTVVSLDNGRLADVGSGGGFPGLPLKILRPELEVFLVESNVKKATFLAEVVRDLEVAPRLSVAWAPRARMVMGLGVTGLERVWAGGGPPG